MFLYIIWLYFIDNFIHKFLNRNNLSKLIIYRDLTIFLKPSEANNFIFSITN